MGILSTILGADDVIKKGIDLIDSLHTSKEEEIQAKNEAKLKLLEAYHPYKVAQRYLALMFTSVIVLTIVGFYFSGGMLEGIFKAKK